MLNEFNFCWRCIAPQYISKCKTMNFRKTLLRLWFLVFRVLLYSTMDAIYIRGCYFFFLLFVCSGLAQSVSQFLIRFIHSLGFILQFYTHLCKRYMCVIGVFVLVSSIFVLNLHVLLLRIGCFGCCLKEKKTSKPNRQVMHEKIDSLICSIQKRMDK